MVGVGNNAVCGELNCGCAKGTVIWPWLPSTGFTICGGCSGAVGIMMPGVGNSGTFFDAKMPNPEATKPPASAMVGLPNRLGPVSVDERVARLRVGAVVDRPVRLKTKNKLVTQSNWTRVECM